VLPYAFEFCRQTGKIEPELRIRPMLESQRGVLEKMDMLASMWLSFVADYIGTSWKLYSDDLTSDDVDLTNGSVIPLSPSQQEDLVPLQAGRMPPEIAEAMQMLGVRWEQGTFPKTLYGQDIGSTAAGYMVSLLNQSGQARLNSMVQATERLFADLLSMTLEITHNYVYLITDKQPIPFSWVDSVDTEDGGMRRQRQGMKLDTSKLKGMYDVEVTLGSMMPMDDQANASLATAYRQPGVTGRPLLSDSTLQQKFQLVESTSDEQLRIDREQAMASPEIQQLIGTVVMSSVREQLLNKLREVGTDVTLVTRAAPLEPMPEPPPDGPMVGPVDPMAMGAQVPPGMMAPGEGPGPAMGPDGMPLGPDGMPLDPEALAMMESPTEADVLGVMPPMPEEEMI
jgi:hypothetical protein